MVVVNENLLWVSGRQYVSHRFDAIIKQIRHRHELRRGVGVHYIDCGTRATTATTDHPDTNRIASRGVGTTKNGQPRRRTNACCSAFQKFTTYVSSRF
jgi:hypothetical protein